MGRGEAGNALLDVLVERLIDGAGVFGVFLLMFAESLFPPLPSEVVMPLAGYAAARGDLAIVPLILAGSLGSLTGATVWFLVARAFGEDRLRRWSDRFGRVLTLTQGDIDRADSWFRKRGNLVVLVGRLIPAVRVLISIPAGLAAMPVRRFLAFSFIGTLVWTGVLMMAGYWLGSSSSAVQDWVSPITIAIVLTCVAVYVARLLTYPRRLRREEAARAVA